MPVHAVTLTSDEQAFANLLAGASGQKRPFLRVDATLTQVARARARDMAQRDYFAHVNPDGNGPNYLVEQAGYPLPDWWGNDRKQNYIESIAAGRSSASATWNDFMNSPAHKRHLLAESDFYQEQTSFGIGHVQMPGSRYGHYWVVLTAPSRPLPAITITSPASGARLSASQVTVSGTAGGGTAPRTVQVRVENATGVGSYITASGTSTWSTAVTGLAPGPNTIRVRSLDEAGTVLAQTTLQVRYVVLTPLTVTVSGSGGVTNGFAGVTQRELGATYTIAAQPALGSIFAGWSGGVTDSRPTVTFTMTEGLQLTASFVSNPFPRLKGAYSATFTAQDDTSTLPPGFISLQLTGTGVFTGRLLIGNAAHVFTGRFDSGGSASVTVRRRNNPALTISLQADVAGNNGVNVSISDGTSTSNTSAYRAYRTTATRYDRAGQYTISLPPSSSDLEAEIPKGNGYATLRVSLRGQVRLTAQLADGASFSRGGWISEKASFPVFASLYAGAGYVAGELRIDETIESDIEGLLRWSKRARTRDRFYPEGFSTVLSVIGSRYKSAANSRAPVVAVAPGVGNSALSLGEGNLDQPIVQTLTIEETNRVRVAPPSVPGLAVTIAPASGVFKGTFRHPVSGQIRPIRGVIIQKQNSGFGFFLGVDQSGYSSLIPK